MTAATLAVDPFVKSHWTDVERRNVEVVADFVQLAMISHDFESLRQRHGSGAYVQHSRGIPDGIEGVAGYLENLTRRFPEYQYDVKQVLVDDEYVTFQSHATTKAKHRGDDRKGFNIIDTWRVIDGRITEHWDAIQPLGTSMRLLALILGGRTANANSVF